MVCLPENIDADDYTIILYLLWWENRGELRQFIIFSNPFPSPLIARLNSSKLWISFQSLSEMPGEVLLELSVFHFLSVSVSLSSFFLLVLLIVLAVWLFLRWWLFSQASDGTISVFDELLEWFDWWMIRVTRRTWVTSFNQILTCKWRTCPVCYIGNSWFELMVSCVVRMIVAAKSWRFRDLSRLFCCCRNPSGDVWSTQPNLAVWIEKSDWVWAVWC